MVIQQNNSLIIPIFRVGCLPSSGRGTWPTPLAVLHQALAAQGRKAR